MRDSKFYYLYIASCERDGGIGQYRLSEDGVCQFVNFTQVDRPMYMVIDSRRMYIVLREPWHNGESGVVVYDIGPDGALINPSAIISTKGEVACHIAVNHKDIYCANYMSGSFIKLPDMLVRHTGHGIHPVRQGKPHVHYVEVTPEERYLCVADLGLDTIFLYDRKNLQLHSQAKVPSGHGVRHLAFSADGRYLFSANELASTVAAFSYCDGKLRMLGVQSVVPATFTGETTASAIRIKNDCLYISNRGHDTISKVIFENDRLAVADHIDCHGKTPRDFTFVDQYLICANQDSDCVVIMDGNRDYDVRAQIKISKPICVCYAEQRTKRDIT